MRSTGQDIGRPKNCCLDDQYCFISNATEPDGSYPVACCKIGNDCAKYNQCPDLEEPEYLCINTITTTILVPGSRTTTGTITAPPAVAIATTTTSCCPRVCDISSFQCPQSLGGGCCPNGQSCMDNACGSFIAPPTTVATIQDPHCSQGQFSCDDKEGGCCSNGAVCTVVSNEGHCASASASATGIRNPGNFTEVATDPPGTLSGGAKAGIGVGVTLAALVIIFITLCFIRRKRRRAATNRAQSDTTSVVMQPGQPMTDVHNSPGGNATRTGWRRGTRDGGAADYFGPRATVGPYTAGDENTPGDDVSPWAGARKVTVDVNERGAVPTSPQGPEDIVPAVEIGGTERRPTLERENHSSDLANHRRNASQQIQDAGVEQQGVEAAPAYESDVGTSWTGQRSDVEFVDRNSRGVGRGSRGQSSLQGDNKEVPEDPVYRHELP